MLIKLPNEVWMDILDWLRQNRREMARKFSALGDRRFSVICQHWLHKYILNVRLGTMWIDDETRANVAIMRMLNWPNSGGGPPTTLVQFADVPVPENVSTFRGIHICYLDFTVLAFLQAMSPLLSRSQVHLSIVCSAGESLNSTLTTLGHLLPLLGGGGIASIDCADPNLYDRFQLLFFIWQHFPAQLLSVKLLQLYADTASFNRQHNIQAIVGWLGTRREDGQPRMLVLNDVSASPALKLVRCIQQHFLTAVSPVSFFLLCRLSQDQDDRMEEQQPTIGNEATDEQLHIRWSASNLLRIGRCPSNFMDGNGWLEAMELKLEQMIVGMKRGQEGRKISLVHPELGPMEPGHHHRLRHDK